MTGAEKLWWRIYELVPSLNRRNDSEQRKDIIGPTNYTKSCCDPPRNKQLVISEGSFRKGNSKCLRMSRMSVIYSQIWPNLRLIALMTEWNLNILIGNCGNSSIVQRSSS